MDDFLKKKLTEKQKMQRDIRIATVFGETAKFLVLSAGGFLALGIVFSYSADRHRTKDLLRLSIDKNKK